MQSSRSTVPATHHRPPAIVSRKSITSETKNGEGGKASSTAMPTSSPTAPVGLMRM